MSPHLHIAICHWHTFIRITNYFSVDFSYLADNRCHLLKFALGDEPSGRFWDKAGVTVKKQLLTIGNNQSSSTQNIDISMVPECPPTHTIDLPTCLSVPPHITIDLSMVPECPLPNIILTYPRCLSVPPHIILTYPWCLSVPHTYI